MKGFRRLQTRLTVLYAGLFGLVLLLLTLTLQVVISANARREVSAQLQSSGAVFQRVWGLQAERLQQGGEVLAQDFGFRQAVATGDAATTRSALENLQGRIHADRAVILKPDGSVIGDAGGIDAARLAATLDPNTASSGVVMAKGQPFMAVAAPVLAPDPQGWVVFALKLGRPQLEALERSASIPLTARILSASGRDAPRGALGGLVSQALAGKPARGVVEGPQGAAMVLATPLVRLDGRADLALSLSYPVAAAMAPYQRLLDAMLAIGAVGLILVVLGGWFVARGVTRPVRVMDDAVQALGAGASADIPVEGRDELARLATSFNAMTRTIRDREAHISRLAYSDIETELGNRRSLERAVAERLAQGGPGLAVGVAAINRFAHVRGAIGYALTHDLVRAVGERLAQAGCGDVARLTTATLGFIFPAGNELDAAAQLEAIVATLRAPFPIGGAMIDVTGVAGFALASQAAGSAEALIERAAIALDQAAAGLKTVSGYDAAAYGDPGRNLSLMSELMTAIGAPELSLAYQPKYDLRLGRIAGAEALSRWRHPVRGPIPPDLFIIMAEETGHIRELTEWAFDRVLEDQGLLTARGCPLEISVNLSARLLNDEEFIADTVRRLEARAAPICLEITETAVISAPGAARRSIQTLADAGLSVSIDDYGSGLSSLAYLRDIQAQELKIDKAFVMGMDADARSALLVRSTVDMGHSLGMKVTAEGVETAETYALLAAMGCDQAQGYFMARPQPLADLAMLLDADPIRPRLAG